MLSGRMYLLTISLHCSVVRDATSSAVGSRKRRSSPYTHDTIRSCTSCPAVIAVHARHDPILHIMPRVSRCCGLLLL